MFNLIYLNKNFQKFHKKDIERFIRPQMRLICNLEEEMENSEINILFQISQSYVISEMYLDGDLLIVLAENGTLFLVDLVMTVKSKIGINYIQQVCK
jgi:predicted nucleotidyltransferase